MHDYSRLALKALEFCQCHADYLVHIIVAVSREAADKMHAFLIGKFLTDPIWWFFLFWLPKFLNTKHGLSLTELGWPLVIIYNMSMVGSIVTS